MFSNLTWMVSHDLSEHNRVLPMARFSNYDLLLCVFLCLELFTETHTAYSAPIPPSSVTSK